MSLTDFNFLFWFLPTSLTAYFLAIRWCGIRVSKWVLLSFSIWFYSFWKVDFLPVFLFSVIINFTIVRTISSPNSRPGQMIRRLVFFAGLAWNLGLLTYYKYSQFLFEQVSKIFNFEFQFHDYQLPLGISFFTFIQIAYLIQSYQSAEMKSTSFVDYAQLVTFFPHLIAGPIVTHDELVPQFNDPGRLRFNPNNVAIGCFLVSLGLFKKLVLADSISEHSALAFDQGAYDGMRAWISAGSYPAQLYFDFSGYVDIAIGVSKMFNFDLPQNFNSPFRATDISDFWRRWHMTLSKFFTTYVYNPLAMHAGRRGGNTNVNGRISIIRLVLIPTLITFLLMGLWHGAGHKFLIFGLWHGVGIVIFRIWRTFRRPMPALLGWAITALYVLIGFVFFRAPSLEVAFNVLDGMFSLHGFFGDPGKGHNLYFIDLTGDPGELWRIAMPTIAYTLALLPWNSQTLTRSFKPNIRFYLLTIGCLFSALVMINRQIPFLYWQF